MELEGRRFVKIEAYVLKYQDMGDRYCLFPGSWNT
jgi:hypothetical protein